MGPGRGRLEKTTFTTRSSQKQNGAHHSKNTYKALSSQNDEEDNIVTCLECNTDFSEEADKLLQCERCLSFQCIKCAKVNPKEYEIFSRPDIHWFCHDCQKPALDAVKSDKIIEDRCNEYLKIFTKRVEKVEQILTTKANNESVNKIDTNVKTLEMKVNGLAGDVSKLGDRCDLIYSDNVEKQKRIKNIVVRGLPESEDITDTDLVKEILTVLDIETTPTSIVRLVKKPEVPPPRNEAAAVDNDNAIGNIKTRPLKIVLVSTETRNNIISRGPRVRNAQEVHFNPKTVFIGPDHTKLEREQDIKLRKELANKRESDPNWLIKNGRIVRKKPRLEIQEKNPPVL